MVSNGVGTGTDVWKVEVGWMPASATRHRRPEIFVWRLFGGSVPAGVPVPFPKKISPNQSSYSSDFFFFKKNPPSPLSHTLSPSLFLLHLIRDP